MTIKIGIFYDGSYFNHVSNYYKYHHKQKSRIDVRGLHEFIRKTIAEKEATEPRFCHIIDAHFFRGRFNAREANEKPSQLYYDRIFDDVLMYNNIQTHYLPLKDFQGRKREKGIDVLMALETYELCMLKRYDVVVLVASDGDHVPLVRKIHSLGCNTMLLGWDFEYTDDSETVRYTRTSSGLWDEVTHPLEMRVIVDEGLQTGNESVKNIFLVSGDRSAEDSSTETSTEERATSEDPFDPNVRHRGTILELKGGFGFIEYPNNNLFFHASNLKEGLRYDDLKTGQELEFRIEEGKEGYVATKITRPGEYKEEAPFQGE